MQPHRSDVEVLAEGPDAAARRVLDHARKRPPTLGSGRLVCIDGPAGSGKTTLATRMLAHSPDAVVLHMDDLFEGWQGLAAVDRQLPGLLRPHAEGRAGRYRRWDWHADRWAETVSVPPAPLLVLEGVGSGSREVADLVTTLVWVEAPLDLRRSRGLDRDGDDFAPHWRSWAEQERHHFATHETRERADLFVDSSEPGEPVSR